MPNPDSTPWQTIPGQTEGKMHEVFVYVADREGKPEDKTRDIERYRIEGDRVIIRYHGGQKDYPYLRRRVAILRGSAVDMRLNVIEANLNGRYQRLAGVTSAVRYTSDNESVCCDMIGTTFESGRFSLFRHPDARITRRASPEAIGYLDYLSEVCEATEEPVTGEDGVPFKYLKSQFDRIGVVDGTPAACLADSKSPVARRKPDGFVIYPFGSNLSQMQAVENALLSQVSVIEGPPGTGKTQTILNVIANLLIRNETVLITSPNVSATDNVTEKLERHGLGFLAARLGRRDNRRGFFANQPPYPEDMGSWILSREERAKLRERISGNASALRKAHETQVELASAKAELDSWKVEYEHFLASFGGHPPIKLKRPVPSGKIERVRDAVRVRADMGRKLPFALRVVFSLAWGVGAWREYATPPGELCVSLNRALMETRIAELRSTIDCVSEGLVKMKSESLVKCVTDDSMAYLKAALAEKFAEGAAARKSFSEESLHAEVEAFRAEYPIVTSTTNAAYNQTKGRLFDYVIVDESSQASIPTGFLALASARNAVVVGDTKQLPCVIGEGEGAVIEKIDEQRNISASLSCARESLLSAIRSSRPDIPHQVLREHYRCHPKIIGFCNQEFYGGELVAMTDDRGLPASRVLGALLTNNRNYDRSAEGTYNQVQAKVFKEDVMAPLLMEGLSAQEIGVVTPYATQSEMMRRDPDMAGVEIGTVHKFQGREKRAVAFVTKKNSLTAFLDNPNLVNVAVSRAAERFFLIAAPRVVSEHGNISNLYRYIGYQGGDVLSSSVCSSFELIYPRLDAERKRWMQMMGYSEDDFYSEAQTEVYVMQAVNELHLEGRVSWIRNYPISLIIRDHQMLDEDEAAFIRNGAHVDFLLYRMVDKSPVMVIEVNGAQHGSQRQAERDKRKRRIFEKAELEMLTIWTNETEVARKIKSSLERCYPNSDLAKWSIVAEPGEEAPWPSSQFEREKA